MMYADIIVDISHEKLDRSFQYRVPQELESQIHIGMVVSIPFGNGNHERRGYVIGLSREPKLAPVKIKPFKEICSSEETTEEKLIALAAWMKERYGGELPYHLFGHSMGSLVVRCYLKKYDDELDSLIVCGSPSENKTAKAAGFLAKTACKMGAHKKGKFFQKMALGLYGKALGEDESENGWISYNKENVKAYDENPLDGFVFSNNGFLNLFLLMDETYNKKGWQVKHPSLPILFIAGADDPCIGSKKQYAQAMTTLKKRGYNQVRGMLFLNRRHEILNEDDVEKVYDAVLHFLEQHSKRDD